MVTGKHIKNKSLFVLFLYVIGFCTDSIAEAWLPETGTYHLSTSFSTIDKRSKDSKNRRASLFTRIRDEVDALYAARDTIHDKVTKEKRSFRNSEIRHIETIEKEIKDLEEKSNMVSAFRDEHFSQLSLEYGISQQQSFGIKLGYIIDKFSGYNDPNHNKEFIGKEADLFYKYQIFKNNKWVISIKPTIEFSSYNNENSCKFGDIAIFAGYSKEKKNGSSIFHEFGFGLRKYFRNSIGNKTGYSTSMMDGIKFNNGIILTNFIQYERSQLKNLIYSHTLYEQISIAKEFKSNQLIKNDFTAQIGYFWKSSLIDKTFVISGPTLSIWLNV